MTDPTTTDRTAGPARADRPTTDHATTDRAGRTRTRDRQGVRLSVAFVGLAVIWGIAFNITGLPFFPLVVAGGIVTGAVGFWVRRVGDDRNPGFGLSPRVAALAVVVALGHYVVGLGLFALGSRILPALTATALAVYERGEGMPLWAQLLLGAGVTATLEEVFWRGAFTPIVADRLGRALPGDVGTGRRGLLMVLVSTAGYTLFHVATLKLALVAAAALGGLVWGTLLLTTRSVGAAILAHVLWTALMLVNPPSL